jgi:hypothetical protein
MRNISISETELTNMAVEALRTRLPSAWAIQVSEGERPGRSRADAVVQITSPDSRTSCLIMEVKSRLEPKDIPGLIWRLRPLLNGGPRSKLFIVAPFLGPLARERLRQEDVGYADKTGNLRLVLEEPAVFVESSGADRDPWPVQRSLRSLKGPAAGRAARAFCDFAPPYGVRELANASHTSAASISRAAEVLEREGVLAREASRGRIASVDWRGVLRRWSQDYSLMRSNWTNQYLEPRGFNALGRKLSESDSKYAVTGSIAAAGMAPVAEARLATIYVPDLDEAAAEFELRPVERGANVVLARPFDPVVFDRTRVRDGVVCAAPSQVAVDLLTGTGRNPAEGEAVLSWMANNEPLWRTPISMS